MARSTETLKALEDLFSLIGQYDAACCYKIDETGLFSRVISQYIVLMPHEDLTNVRGKMRAKDKVTLVVCCNCSGTEVVMITMMGKANQPTFIVGII